MNESDAIEAGVLTPCSESSEWVHQKFLVPKPGRPEVRLVADFKRLNSALQRPTYPVESNSQLLRHLHPDSKYFCTLDMTSGYHQIAVHEDDRHSLTVISTQGRFRYNSLSQGICSASDFFNFLQMLAPIDKEHGWHLDGSTHPGQTGVHDRRIPPVMPWEKYLTKGKEVLNKFLRGVWRM